MITKSQKVLSKKYILYKIFTSLWFIGAVWLYFYRLFINDQQVGVLDGIAFTIGLIAEVPSGALADKFGRDKLVKSGQVLGGLGLIIQGLSNSFLFLIVGQTILMIGISFISGADEALFYENINFDKNTQNWRKLVTRGSQIALMGTLIATIIGSALHNINPRIPWILTGLCFLFSTSIIWNIKDLRLKKTQKNFFPEIKDYLNDIKTGFGQFRFPKLRLYVPFIITVQGLFYTTGYGLLRLILLDRFNFSPFLGSLALASCSLITVGLLGYFHKYSEKFSEKKALLIIGFIACASLLLSLANIGLYGYIVLLSLYAGEYLLQPIISEVLNKKVEENQRATILSVASFFKILPYTILAPIIGSLNYRGKIEYFFIVWSIMIFISLVIYLSLRKKDSIINIADEMNNI